jgi:hypothetical protein
MPDKFTAKDNGKLFYSPDADEVGYLEYPLEDKGGARSDDTAILWVHGGTGWYYVEPYEVQPVIALPRGAEICGPARARRLEKKHVWPDDRKRESSDYEPPEVQ